MAFKQSFVFDLLEKLPWFACELHESSEIGSHLFGETFLVYQFELHLFPRLFVELVYR